MWSLLTLPQACGKLQFAKHPTSITCTPSYTHNKPEAGGTFGRIWHNLDYLMVRGPLRDYFPDLTNIILVVYPRNVTRVGAFFLGCSLQIVTPNCYLGGFVGAKEAQESYLGEKVEGWQDLVSTLAGVACRHPQTAYAGL